MVLVAIGALWSAAPPAAPTALSMSRVQRSDDRRTLTTQDLERTVGGPGNFARTMLTGR